MCTAGHRIARNDHKKHSTPYDDKRRHEEHDDRPRRETARFSFSAPFHAAPPFPEFLRRR
jgi:hypothetical protein